MKDAYLIAYDITDDKLRAKTANKLIYYGLERVQFSVFIGTIRVKNLLAFKLWYQKTILTLASPNDSLMILPLSIGQVRSIEVIGHNALDLDYLTDQKHTLIL